jgi:hypothetical protein
VGIPPCVIELVHHNPPTGVKYDRASQQLNTPQLASGSTFALTMPLKAARQGGSQSRAATSDRDALAFACSCDIVAEARVGMDEDSDGDECDHVTAARSLYNLPSRSGAAHAGSVLSRRGRKIVQLLNRASAHEGKAAGWGVSSDNPRCVHVHLRPSARAGGRGAPVISAVASSYFSTPVISAVLTTGSSIPRCVACRILTKERGLCRHEVDAKEDAEAAAEDYFFPQVSCDAVQGAESGENRGCGWEQPLDGVSGSERASERAGATSDEGERVGDGDEGEDDGELEELDEVQDEVHDDVQAEDEAGKDYKEGECESFYLKSGVNVRNEYASLRRRPLLACASDIATERHRRLLIKRMPSQGRLSYLDLSDLRGICRSVGCIACDDGGANYVDVPSAEIRKEIRGVTLETLTVVVPANMCDWCCPHCLNRTIPKLLTTRWLRCQGSDRFVG